jgi:hypothetical protein
MPNEIVEAGGNIKQIVPQSITEIRHVAQLICKSGVVPKQYQGKPDAIAAAIMHGLEVGLPPMAALQNIAVINGMPSLWGDGALALIQGSGVIEDIEETIEGEGEGILATCTIKRNDRKTATVRTFSAQDAKEAGLWGKPGPWQNYKKRMCQMRARSWAMRDACPDVLKGLHIAEEMQDVGGNYQQAPAPASDRPERVVEPQPEADNIVDAEVEEIEQEEGVEALSFEHIDKHGELVATYPIPEEYIKALYAEGFNINDCDVMIAFYEHNVGAIDEAVAILDDTVLEKYLVPLTNGYERCLAKKRAEQEKAETDGE